MGTGTWENRLDAWVFGTLRRMLATETEGDEWFDQRRSPLVGHRSTVQARILAGKSGARIDGDRYLLSSAALAEELSNGAT